jgi:hypothetical protein
VTSDIFFESSSCGANKIIQGHRNFIYDLIKDCSESIKIDDLPDV